jgi:hypothetical protein
MKNRFAFLLLVAVLVGFTGCTPAKKKNRSTSQTPPSKRVIKQQKNDTELILTLSRTNLSTAETLEISLEVLAPKERKAVLPELKEKIPSFMVADEYFDDPKTEAEQVRYRAEWILYPTLPGTITFPSLKVQLGTNTLSTLPQTLQIRSMLPPGTENAPLRGMAPPEKLLAEQKAQRVFLRILLLSALTGSLLIFIPWLFWKLRKRRPLKPHQKALLALEKLPSAPPARLHALPRIFCTYITERWSLALEGKTGKELLALLQDEDLNGEKEAALHFFTQVDPARFSHCVPENLPQEAESTLRVFIANTFESKEESS